VFYRFVLEYDVPAFSLRAAQSGENPDPGNNDALFVLRIVLRRSKVIVERHVMT
jgi:hypothetical protein